MSPPLMSVFDLSFHRGWRGRMHGGPKASLCLLLCLMTVHVRPLVTLRVPVRAVATSGLTT